MEKNYARYILFDGGDLYDDINVAIPCSPNVLFRNIERGVIVHHIRAGNERRDDKAESEARVAQYRGHYL